METPPQVLVTQVLPRLERALLVLQRLNLLRYSEPLRLLNNNQVFKALLLVLPVFQTPQRPQPLLHHSHLAHKVVVRVYLEQAHKLKQT